MMFAVLSGLPIMAQDNKEDALYRGRNADAVVTERLQMRMRDRLRQQVQQALAEPSKARDVQPLAEAPPPLRRARATPADM